MGVTQWIDVMTSRRLDHAELDVLHRRARRLYEANTHIFEDEAEALEAMGVRPADGVEASAGSTDASSASDAQLGAPPSPLARSRTARATAPNRSKVSGSRLQASPPR